MKRNIDTMLWYLMQNGSGIEELLCCHKVAHKCLHPEARLPGIQDSEEDLH